MPVQLPVPSGLLVVDKPAGITSHQVVARARRALGTKKVGHAGTLDPMATGVLVLGVERATRLLGHLLLTDKAYTATIRFGQATITDDAEGDVTEVRGAGDLTRARVEDALTAYRGDIVQVPSAVSAIKVAGQRSYARVRAGETVELAGRPVTISSLELGEVRPGLADDLAVLDADVTLTCTSGTYVRALARDLGRDLEVGAHLVALRRTRVGPFGLAEVTWDAELGDLAPGERTPLQLTSMADAARATFPVVEVDAEAARDVSYGRPLAVVVPADPTGVLHDGVLIALYAPRGEQSVPVAVLV